MTRGLVDRDIHPPDRLRKRVGDRLELSVGLAGDEATVVEQVSPPDVEVVFVTSRVPITRRVLAEGGLSVVAKIGTGLDSVDLEAARELGIPVTNTPGINALSVAEHAVGLALATRRHVVRGDRTLEAGGWRDEMPLGSLLSRTTVGIVGFGNVGRRIAALLRGFDVDVLAHDPYVDAIEGEPVAAEFVDLETLLGRADTVFVAAELTDETRGLIDADAFDAMGEGCVLVNTSRGPIVEEAALLDALEGGRLAGAGLDVFAEEPLPADSPLHDREDVVLTPHVAGVTATAREDALDRLGEHAVRLLDGDPVPERYLATPPGAG